MTTLAIMHMPNHAPSLTKGICRKALRHARRNGVRSIGTTELYHQIPFMHHRPLWRLLVGASKSRRSQFKGGHGDAGDNPLLVRRTSTRVLSWMVKASDALHPHDPYAPERWLYGEAYKHQFGIIEHITAHPNAMVRPGAEGHEKRLPGYKDEMALLEARLRTAKRNGHIRIVSGDLNLADHSREDYSPHVIFERQNMLVWHHGIDWIAYDKELKLVDQIVIPPGEQGRGQDHPWLIAKFEKRD